MESIEFKKVVDNIFKEHKFSKKGNSYTKNEDEVFCVIGLQRSSYSNSYYINVGYVIKQIHPEFKALKYYQADMKWRFWTCNINKSPDCFDLDELDMGSIEKIKACLISNINQYLDSRLSLSGLKQLIIDKPVILYQTSPAAKDLFGIPRG
jgi:Domain of unknown function (DUF4304)